MLNGHDVTDLNEISYQGEDKIHQMIGVHQIFLNFCQIE